MNARGFYTHECPTCKNTDIHEISVTCSEIRKLGDLFLCDESIKTDGCELRGCILCCLFCRSPGGNGYCDEEPCLVMDRSPNKRLGLVGIFGHKKCEAIVR